MTENKIRANVYTQQTDDKFMFVELVWENEGGEIRRQILNLYKEEAEEICKRINTDPELTRKEERAKMMAKVEEMLPSVKENAKGFDDYFKGQLNILEQLKSYLGEE